MSRKKKYSNRAEKKKTRQKRSLLWLVMLAGAVAAALALWRLGAREQRPPWNLLLVSIDTLRADHLSAYQEGAGTPNMDRLAREGILFETAQTVAPTTLPAHASLFTATLPPRHGVRDNLGFYLPENATTLASHLEDQGYRTGGFVGAFVLDSGFGIARGFDTYFDDFDTLTENVAAGFVSQRPGGAVVERALAWLETVYEGSSPFFAFVHLYDPHTPYSPPDPFAKNATTHRALYRGEVHYVDTLVGELLDWLDETKLTDRTLVVLTSDHGESLGEHGELTHGLFIYESTLRIPLLLRYPGAPAGTRVPTLARLVDVAPTMLDLMQLPALDDSANIDGVSLLPVIEDPEKDWPATAYAESLFPRVHYGWSELKSLRSGRHKLVLAPKSELYDLEADPTESRNVIASQPAVASRLRAELDKVEDVLSSPGREDVSDEMRARLASLGYVGSGASRATLADPKDRLELYHTLNDPELMSVEPSDVSAFEGALIRLERAIGDEPTASRAYVLYGELLLKGGRPRDAAAAFETLVSFDASYEGLFGLGMARQRLSELDLAEAAYQKALEREPLNAKSHYRLSQIEEARGNIEAAEEWLRKAIALSPDRVLKETLATLLLSSGRRDEASALLDAIAREGRADPAALYDEAQSFLLSGSPDEALVMFRAAAAAAPENPNIQHGIGNALQATGDLEGAIRAYRRAVEQSPCFAGAYSNLGATLMRLGRLDEAKDALTKAVACDPSHILGYRNLAAVQLELKDVAAAIETLTRAQRRAPEDEQIARDLANLEAYRDRGRD